MWMFGRNLILGVLLMVVGCSAPPEAVPEAVPEPVTEPPVEVAGAGATAEVATSSPVAETTPLQPVRAAPTAVVSELRARADALDDEGLYPQALELRRQIVTLEPDARSRFELGMALTRASHYDEAEKSYLAVLQELPRHPQTLLNLGNLNRLRGNAEEATGWYRKAIESDPNYLRAFYNLAELLYDEGRPDNALAAWLSVLELAPRNPAEQAVYNDSVWRAGATFFEKGDAEQAFALLQPLLEAAPRHRHAHYTMGQVLLTLGREEQAAAEFETHATLLAARRESSATATETDR
jgi:tetratricopeptide (TPR) repeat protein